MKRSYPRLCLFRSNVSDVKMVPVMPYRTNVARIFGHKIIYRKLKRTVMLNTSWQREITSVGIKSVIFNGRSTLELSCRTRNTLRDARNILQI